MRILQGIRQRACSKEEEKCQTITTVPSLSMHMKDIGVSKVVFLS